MNETSTVKTENKQICHFPTDTEENHHHHHQHTRDTEENQTQKYDNEKARNYELNSKKHYMIKLLFPAN